MSPRKMLALCLMAMVILAWGVSTMAEVPVADVPPQCCNSSTDCPGKQLCCLSPSCTNPNDPNFPGNGTCWDGGCSGVGRPAGT